MLRKQILLLGNKKNVFAWSQKHFCFPDTNFASETYVSQFSHDENNVDEVPVPLAQKKLFFERTDNNQNV